MKKNQAFGPIFFTYNEKGSRTPERGEDETAHFARTLAAVQNGTADTQSESGATKKSRGAVISTICKKIRPLGLFFLHIT